MKSNEAVKLEVDFSNLQNPETIKKEIEKLQKGSEPLNHSDILAELMEQIRPVNFLELAFPKYSEIAEQLEEVTKKSFEFANSDKRDDPEAQRATDEMKRLSKQLDKMTVTKNHLLILSIENILKVAEQKKWGICKNQDFIYLYNGAFWKEIDKEEFQRFLGEASEKMGVEKFLARIFRFREELFKQFLATAYLPTPESNQEKVLINLQNGTFQIEKNGKTKLRQADRNDFLTYQLKFPYDEKAKAPLFLKYLNRVLPDATIQNIVAEYLGYVFIKHGSQSLKIEKMLVLYGGGANGKSVLFDIINAILGEENVSSFSLQELTDNSGYYRAMIANKLVNYASEINGKLETSNFKKMVSGEPIPARLPYGKPMTLKQYAK